ncbi:hypothetical protein BKA67DRAFT_566971 [Truncatella angustata]|uniref:Uncharacterized protein n=1 Tax=Truncatella angustata TaxID=152316 RepID=A0A9P8ZVG6_9PEZI|nr:uncharacterized protein BKA67DRAFT_566971 [Truncatella angustata]KAH6652590.1 hypothetical protein BKA67DRAFT_566971 [Truncatella angustata]
MQLNTSPKHQTATIRTAPPCVFARNSLRQRLCFLLPLQTFGSYMEWRISTYSVCGIFGTAHISYIRSSIAMQ